MTKSESRASVGVIQSDREAAAVSGTPHARLYRERLSANYGLEKADFHKAAPPLQSPATGEGVVTHEPPASVEREAPEYITYNPVYQRTYEGADPTRGCVYTRASILPALRCAGSGTDWQSPDQAPDQASGTDRFYVVTVNRKDGKKPFTFAALYLRDFLLEWDDEARHVTGWYSEDSDGYAELLREGDTLLGWQYLPVWDANTRASTPARPTREELVDQLEAALQRAAAAENRLHNYSQHRAARWKQMADFIQSRAPAIWADYATLSVNGSLYTDEGWTEPTYERAMNSLRHRAERAEEEAASLRARASQETERG